MGRTKNIIVILVLVVILLIGNRLRTYSYATVPHPGEVADEYSYGWLGINLLRYHYPTTWSTLSVYPKISYEKINVDAIFDKDPSRKPFPIASPVFDHPPLFPLISGGYAYLKGVRNFADAGVGILRRPMLYIAVLTVILIFVFSYLLFGLKVGILSALLYSVIPTTVISSRLALMENGIIPLFLLSLILAILFIKKQKMRYWVAACLCVVVAMLFKISAVSIGITLVLIALMYGKNSQKIKLIAIVAGAVTVAISLFALYGAAFDWKTFVTVFGENSHRFYGASSEVFLQAVADFRITTNKFLTDGWMLAGWISFFVVSYLEFRKTLGGNILTMAVFSYFIVFIIFGSESYGWYKYPFFPFLIISLAYFLIKLYEKSNLMVFFGLMLLPFGSSVHRLIGVERFQAYVPYLRAGTVVLLIIFAADLVFKKRFEKVSKLAMVIFLIFVILLSMQEIYFYNYSNWFFVT